MSKQKYNVDPLFYFILGILYVFSLSEIILLAGNINVPPSTVLIYSIVTVTFFYFFFYSPYVSSIIIIFCTFTFSILILLFEKKVIASSWYENFIKHMGDYFKELIYFLRGYLPYTEKFNKNLTLITTTAISFWYCVNSKVRYHFYVLSLTGFSIFGFIQVKQGIENKFLFMIFLFCFIGFLVKYMNISVGSKLKKVMKETYNSSYIILPICLIVTLIASILPHPVYEEQVFINRQDSLVDGYEKARALLNLSSENDYFSFNSTGFSGRDKELGGKVNPANKFIMEVFSDERVYLAGAIKDTYTGRMWTNAQTNQELLRSSPNNSYPITDDFIKTRVNEINDDVPWGDPVNVRVSIFDYEDSSYEDISLELERKELKIDVWKNSTKTIFVPSGGYNIKMSDNRNVYKNNNSFVSDELMADHYTYTVDYISKLYTDGEYIKALITNSKHDVSKVDRYDTDFSNKYLGLPDTLPQRVIDLALSITDGAESDYEKVKKIEDYLKEFPYTLQPEEIPPDVDFVDYFLFTGQKGYCTYFASALCVMARAVGVPTRYVEGFSMPVAKNANGGYSISSQHAHAWPEVYLNDFGWVQFEPTPPYNYNFYGEEMPNAEEVFDPEMLESEAFNEHKKALGLDVKEKPKPEPETTPELEVSEPTAPETNEPPEFSPIKAFLKFIFFIFIVLIIVLTILCLGIFIDYLKFKKIDKLPANEGVVKYFSYTLKIMQRLGYPTEKNETPKHFAKRLGKDIGEKYKELPLDDLADIYNKAMYSNKEISDIEIKKIKKAYLSSLEELKDGLINKIKFAINKYILFKY